DNAGRFQPTLMDRLRAAWTIWTHKTPATVPLPTPTPSMANGLWKKRRILPGEREHALAWFKTLGLPELKGKKFVCVATGRDMNVDGKLKNTYIEGFLLEEQANTFSVMTLSAEIETFRRSPRNSPAHKQVSYEIRDLAKEAAACLAA